MKGEEGHTTSDSKDSGAVQYCMPDGKNPIGTVKQNRFEKEPETFQVSSKGKKK